MHRLGKDEHRLSQVSGFPPVVGARPRVLILGSMPGKASLERQQYYAHPRNAYWPIMGALFGAGPDLPYAKRLSRLTDCGIVLWDVLENCFRPGSLDASIMDKTALPNDFASFFVAHDTIRHVFFNGRKAAEVFRRKVLPDLGGAIDAIELRTLPSTSPAHASRSYQEKLREWSIVRDVLRGEQ